jgi:dipeptidyl aminopeptidase/acylaminoacyl peptidase
MSPLPRPDATRTLFRQRCAAPPPRRDRASAFRSEERRGRPMVARAASLIVAIALFATPAAAQLRPITLDDYPAWSRITEVDLSADGRWMTYAYAPNKGDTTFHVRALDAATVHTAKNAGSAAFSDDGRWVGYLVRTGRDTARAGGAEGRAGGGGGRGGRGGAAQGGGTGPARTLELIELATGTKTVVPGVQSFRFSPDGRFVAVDKARAAGATHQGHDLILVELATGSQRNIGNVASHAFNESGALLAYVVDAAGKTGNGLYLLDPANGATRALDTDTLRYDALTWNEDGTAVAALRGEVPPDQEQRANTLVAFRGLDVRTATAAGSRLEPVVYDPAADSGFPQDMVLSELASLTWSDDGARVFAGVKQQQEEVDDEAPDGQERTNVEIWHWADERIQSQQKVQAAADRRATYAAAIALDAGKLVRLEDDAMPRTEVTSDARWAIGQQDDAYRFLFDEAGGLRDLVRVDVATGDRTTLAERVRFPMGVSPDGRRHAWFKDGKLMVQEIATGEAHDVSALASASFLNAQADRPGEKGSYGLAGWSKDGRTLLANARFDIWQLPVDGDGEAVNLTRGVGDRDGIQFRVVTLDEEAAEDGIDTSQPILLSAYGERTKKAGYWIVEPGREPRPLIWQDRAIDDVRKAEDADRLIFTAQTFEEFPNWWATNLRFENPVRITDANPQQSQFAWGRRVLVDFTDQRGNELQATLTLPAGYQEGQRYPMLVYFYERLSQNHHSFSMPVYDDRPHFSAYASDGYLVLMPDIVYDDGKPGSSALDDVTSAVRKVIELGYADPDHIGLQGHSWGGYESSFIVTQTDMFAAVVTGAPLTNLESMHNILYKQSGMTNASLIQWGQGRMGTVPWRDPEGYASQSPVRFVDNISTPFLILHGTADGAVDWNQGLEFYIAARRAGKEVILLSYPDEPHHLRMRANQIDFQRRMKEYFDHHLKGEPAPAWMTEGVPFLERSRKAAVTTDGNDR